MKHLMSGNEATARGVYEAGIKICSAYPGTPSTEILENLPQYKDDVYCEWAPNEKVATEVAYGASIAGSRSFCTMKMVGLNVAADPLFTAGYMGVGGAFIVVTADDPSCHSSQNEQDNRHYARAAKIAMVEPSDAQECKDFVALACEVSELFDTPVLYRTTTRVCHSKGLVEFGERREHTHAPYARNVRKFVCTPAHAYANHPIVEERLKKLEEYGCTRALENGLNKLEMGDGKVGVVTSSIAYEYAKEVFPEGTSFLKLGLTFPLPMDLIRDFASRVKIRSPVRAEHPASAGAGPGPEGGLPHRGCDPGQAAPGPVSRLPPPRLLLYPVPEQELCGHRRHRLLYPGLRRAPELHGLRGVHGRGLLRRYGHRQEL